jgi:hypothetical protein
MRPDHNKATGAHRGIPDSRAARRWYHPPPMRPPSPSPCPASSLLRLRRPRRRRREPPSRPRGAREPARRARARRPQDAPSPSHARARARRPPVDPTTPLAGEKHFNNKLRQLTNGGENAEAYFSFDEQRLVFQSTRDGAACDQIYTLTSPTARRSGSSGKGRTTCAYFLPKDQRILYASTHAAADDCLPEPDRSRGYVWKLYPEFDIYTAKADGSDVQPLVTSAPATTPRPPSRRSATASSSPRPATATPSSTDEDRRQGRQAPDQHPRLRRRRLLLARRQAPRLPRQPPRGRRGARQVRRDPQGPPGPPDPPRAVRDERRRQRATAGHEQRQGQLRPVLPPRRQAHHLQLEPGRPEGPRLRPVPHRRRRQRPGAGHLQPQLRRLPDVHPRRQAAGVRVQPRRRQRGRHQRVPRRGLDGTRVTLGAGVTLEDGQLWLEAPPLEEGQEARPHRVGEHTVSLSDGGASLSCKTAPPRSTSPRAWRSSAPAADAPRSRPASRRRSPATAPRRSSRSASGTTGPAAWATAAAAAARRRRLGCPLRGRPQRPARRARAAAHDPAPDREDRRRGRPRRDPRRPALLQPREHPRSRAGTGSRSPRARSW